MLRKLRRKFRETGEVERGPDMRLSCSRHAAAVCAVLAALSAAEVHASLIVEGLYQLHNHPDGNQASPFYGLRLDELFQVTPGHDVFTFDFDHPDAAVVLAAIESLRAEGDPDAIPEIEPLLDDEVPEIQDAAQAALDALEGYE